MTVKVAVAIDVAVDVTRRIGVIIDVSGELLQLENKDILCACGNYKHEDVGRWLSIEYLLYSLVVTTELLR